MRGTDCDARWKDTTPLSMCPVMCSWDLSDICVNHATVGVLSDSMPDIVNFISTSLCSNNYFKITAAISKSDFVNQPWGLLYETNSLVMVLSNSTLQMKGFNFIVPLCHSPLSPALQALNQPYY